MKRKHWSVWTEKENIDNVIMVNEKIVYRGNEKECKSYYKKHGGSKNDLHVGYTFN